MNPLAAVLSIGDTLIKRLFPDPASQQAAQLALLEMAQRGELAEMTARAEIVKAEAQSEHWLVATWRPILMLTFGALIVARWFGWAAPELSEAEYLKLWSIVEFGIGGYVVSRSVEKVVPHITDAIKSGGLRK